MSTNPITTSASATISVPPTRAPRKPRGPAFREEKVSRALSKLLRHQATNAGIQLDMEGFAPLDKVLMWGPLKLEKVTFADVWECARDNVKQRFTLKLKDGAVEESTDTGDWLIRANQGHSIKIESAGLLTEITPGDIPATVLHGTFFAFWPAIVSSGGLSRINRNHVHCAEGIPGQDAGVISGMRGDAELLIEVDIEASMSEGIKWWRSTNGVILTEGNADGVVPLRFFRKVTGRKVDVGVLAENGEVIGELPKGLKMKVPQGKKPWKE